jgi:hypothetical protein
MCKCADERMCRCADVQMSELGFYTIERIGMRIKLDSMLEETAKGKTI